MNLIWHWPQVVAAVLCGIELAIHMAKDGEPRGGKFSAGCKLVDLLILAMLLYFGGFWMGTQP